MDKKLLTGLAALTLLDLSGAPANAQNWNGVYVGIHGGYRWSEGELSTPAYVLNNPVDVNPLIGPRAENYNLDGAIAGLQVGYNLSVGGPWVVGIEADVSFGDGDDTKMRTIMIDGVAYRLDSRAELGTQGTLRGRVGFNSGPLLIFGTAGVAFADFDWQETFSRPGAFSISVSKSELLTGWVLGGGAEFALSRRWIIRADYLYENFGSISVPLAAALPTGTNGTMDVDAHKVRIGISYEFE